MPLFDYQAAGTGGKMEKGRMDAADESAVMAQLRAEGRYPVSIRKREPRESMLPSLGVRIPSRKLAAFCLQMSAMLSAGVALETALDMCARQSGDKRLQKALTEALEGIRGGRSLLDAFRRQTGRFPDTLLHLIEAGETSGTPDVCFRRAGQWLTRSAGLTSKIRGALVYPAFLLVLTVGIFFFLTVSVIPQFVLLYERRGADIPPLTGALIGFSRGIREQGLYWLIGLAAVFILWRLWLATARGRIAQDHFKLRIPLFGKLSSVFMAARYARSLSILSGAGVPLTQALEVSGRSLGNRYGQAQIGRVIDAVRGGRPVSAPLEELGIFPPLLIHMTRMGEESGRTEELLDQAAAFFEEESETAVQRLVTLLEPAVIVVMGGLVLLVVLAVVVPMFNMYALV